MVAKTKPKKTRRKKRKISNIPERNRIVEYEEWKTGDICWTVPYGEVSPVRGEIVEFFPKDNIAPAAAITIIPGGKFRVVKCSLIATERKEAKELWQKEKEDSKK